MLQETEMYLQQILGNEISWPRKVLVKHGNPSHVQLLETLFLNSTVALHMMLSLKMMTK
jgi:hypothetical protein